ncbi:hypothetical protein AAHE18_12G233000 [Arachis hypogaea]
MAKGIRNLSCWMEVAPAPVIFPTKPSNSPRLETIAEEEAAEGYDRHQNKKLSMSTLQSQEYKYFSRAFPT